MSEQVAEYEKKLLVEAIRKHGSLTNAAKALGMSFRQMRYRVYKHGLKSGSAQPAKKEPLVYFVQFPLEPQLIKIGHTMNLQKRLIGLMTTSAMPLRVLGVLAGGFAKEQELQLKFRKHRHHGEWFSPDPEVLAFIAENCSPPCLPPSLGEQNTGAGI